MDVQKYSYDLPPGGLEVPCVYTFETISDNESTKTQKASEMVVMSCV